MSHDLRLERVFDAAPEDVFDAFTDPDAQKESYAFTQGLQLTAAISAAIAVCMAILAAILLRRVPSGSELDTRADPDQESAIAASSRIT